jgi:hypothetical protein
MSKQLMLLGTPWIGSGEGILKLKARMELAMETDPPQTRTAAPSFPTNVQFSNVE